MYNEIQIFQINDVLRKNTAIAEASCKNELEESGWNLVVKSSKSW